MTPTLKRDLLLQVRGVGGGAVRKRCVWRAAVSLSRHRQRPRRRRRETDRPEHLRRQAPHALGAVGCDQCERALGEPRRQHASGRTLFRASVHTRQSQQASSGSCQRGSSGARLADSRRLDSDSACATLSLSSTRLPQSVTQVVLHCRVFLGALLQLEYVLEDTQRARAFGHCLQPGVVELMKQVTTDDENHVCSTVPPPPPGPPAPTLSPRLAHSMCPIVATNRCPRLRWMRCGMRSLPPMRTDCRLARSSWPRPLAPTEFL